MIAVSANVPIYDSLLDFYMSQRSTVCKDGKKSHLENIVANRY
jgi:hypothetical protein